MTIQGPFRSVIDTDQEGCLPPDRRDRAPSDPIRRAAAAGVRHGVRVFAGARATPSPRASGAPGALAAPALDARAQRRGPGSRRCSLQSLKPLNANISATSIPAPNTATLPNAESSLCVHTKVRSAPR